jgi:hypothetical protein
MEVFTAATLLALVTKFTGVVKYLSNREWRAVATQVLSWVVATAAVMIAAQADVAENLTTWGNIALSDLDFWSQVLAGIAVGSGASVIYDYEKVFDNTNTAVEPRLGLLDLDRSPAHSSGVVEAEPVPPGPPAE